MPADHPEPPITPLDSPEPPFDPAAASAPGPSGPVISPDDPDAPYGSFGDATGATTIYPPEGGIVRVERETYRDEWTVTVTDVTDEPAPPEPAFDAPRPIEDMSLEELLDQPIDGTSQPTTDAADSDDAARSDDERPEDERPDDEPSDDEPSDDEPPDDEHDEPEAPDGGARFLRP